MMIIYNIDYAHILYIIYIYIYRCLKNEVSFFGSKTATVKGKTDTIRYIDMGM